MSFPIFVQHSPSVQVKAVKTACLFCQDNIAVFQGLYLSQTLYAHCLCLALNSFQISYSCFSRHFIEYYTCSLPQSIKKTLSENY